MRRNTLPPPSERGRVAFRGATERGRPARTRLKAAREARRAVRSALLALLAALGLAIAPATPAPAATISYRDLLARPRPAGALRIAYGPAASQFGELYLPKGKAPRRVVVLIHGGCWLASLPGLELMAYLAGDLVGRGFAVWNLEYRRIGEAGGGYPGTFLDVAKGVDYLRVLAPRYDLDLRHVVLVGHSAGGHLALWAAARPRLPAASPLFTPDPLRVSGVLSLAGIGDLAAFRESGGDVCGGPSTIDALVGADRRPAPARYADTSPAALLSGRPPQVIVSGALDPIVPPRFGDAFVAKTGAAGDMATGVKVSGAGHFELIDPDAPAWRVEERLIEVLFKEPAH